MSDPTRAALAEGALFTDQYQLVMAQLYVREGLHERRAQFDHFHRTNPDYGTHQAGFVVTAGLDSLLDWMERARFGPPEIDALAGQRTAGGARRFDDDFLSWLADEADFGDVRLSAVPEGRVVHPHEPVVMVEGPLAVAQLLETPLLNHVNYASLIATKAARVARAARGGDVLEFGMRRGAATAVNVAGRAALIGGCGATSNVGLSHALGVDPKGTHAHSMVQAHLALSEDGGGELAAFRAFAHANPDDCILLVDTVDTLASGMPNAIEVFHELRAAGHEPVGVRLDSGDLAHLAVRAAAMLDDAGFPDTTIVLSNQLDELAIWQILTQVEEEAPGHGLDPQAVVDRLVYGVGTRLITSAGSPALDGVYKLVGVEGAAGALLPAVKLSENPAKIPVAGAKSLWRLHDGSGTATADVVAAADERPDTDTPLALHHPHDADKRRTVPPEAMGGLEPLHEVVWDDGRTRPAEDLDALRERRRADMARLDPGVLRLVNPHRYHVSLTSEMARTQKEAVAAVRPG